VPTERRTRRGAGRPPRISRSEILAVARDLGIDELSMGALAERLGVTRQALYYYFPSKAELLAGLAAQERIPLPPSDGRPWQEWVIAAGFALRDLISRYQLDADVASAGMNAAWILLLEEFHRVLLRAGLAPSEVAHAASVLGSVSFSAARPFHRVKASSGWLSRLYDDLGLGPDSPLRAMIPVYEEYDRDVWFRRNLEFVVAGLEHRLMPAAPAR
jgi:AcrR family transcriptional regulator